MVNKSGLKVFFAPSLRLRDVEWVKKGLRIGLGALAEQIGLT